jgi:hypothetical protein
LTGLNSGYRVYQVDTKTFSVMGAQTYFANMSNSLKWTKPVWEFEYDTREAYSVRSDSEDSHSDSDSVEDNRRRRDDSDRDSKHGLGVPWPSRLPLNATFWHLVTEKMLNDTDFTADPPAKSELLQLYELYEAKSSTDPNRRVSGGTESPEQKVCFLRAGSGYLGRYCRERYGGGDARSLREREFEIR